MENNWIKIYTSADFQQAEQVRQFLIENEVDAVMMNKQDSSYHFGLIHIYIHPADFNRATELIILNEL